MSQLFATLSTEVHLHCLLPFTEQNSASYITILTSRLGNADENNDTLAVENIALLCTNPPFWFVLAWWCTGRVFYSSSPIPDLFLLEEEDQMLPSLLTGHCNVPDLPSGDCLYWIFAKRKRSKMINFLAGEGSGFQESYVDIIKQTN